MWIQWNLAFCFISGLTSLASSYSLLSDRSLHAIPDPGSDFDINNGALLAPILVPRIPGTPGSLAVLQHFVTFFRTSLPQWSLEFQNSTSTTPATGERQVPFVNLIATRDPPWSSPGEVSRLALVAHYDSKMTPEGFIGATDSAAPCAMLMHAARSIDGALTRKWAAMKADGDMGDGIEAQKGVQIILLDGEEAFINWSDTDSLYGARALAETWETARNPAMSTFHSPLASISLFLLLDLLGAANPRVPSYFITTHWAYKAMASIESRLRDLQELKSSPNHRTRRGASDSRETEPTFLVESNKADSQFRGAFVLDDHVPFMARGVEVLHIIPTPFPAVWHTSRDDGEHLDIDTVEDWAKLTTAFAAEWLDLEGYLEIERVGENAMRSVGPDNVQRKSEL